MEGVMVTNSREITLMGNVMAIIIIMTRPNTAIKCQCLNKRNKVMLTKVIIKQITMRVTIITIMTLIVTMGLINNIQTTSKAIITTTTKTSIILRVITTTNMTTANNTHNTTITQQIIMVTGINRITCKQTTQ